MIYRTDRSSLDDCTRCDLHRFRRQIVRARGVTPCQALFLGIAPGKSENLIGRAFVGPAGKVLNFLLEDLRLDERRVAYYITNCCACRPCDSKTAKNRDPTPEEILACMPRVHAEINAAQPSKIVLLGVIPAKYYGKEYPQALHVAHPSFLLQSGGSRPSRAAPMYRPTLRALEDYLEDL
jgi:uracil-DNA glycosylase family 4